MRFRHTLLVFCIATTPAFAHADEGGFQKTLIDPVPDYRGGTGAVSSIIYVNDCQPGGCFIRAGDVNDALTDTSTVPETNALLAPFDHPQEQWDLAIECIREVFAPYDVEVVTEDPGDVAHHEAILAGSGTQFGFPSDVLGVAPLSCGGAIDNAISFSFANSMESDWLRMCWTVAQESAHAYGLDHVFSCPDPMTYIDSCGQKFFRNRDLVCGDFSEKPCFCGGDTQNSHRELRILFGPGVDPPAPELSIVQPVDGDTVPDTWLVQLAASDKRLVDRVEVYINDWLYETIPGHGFHNASDPYIFEPDDALADGVINLQVVAYNDLELSSSASITVTKGAPCTDAASCADGQECDAGACFWPTPTGQLGDSCVRAMDCVSLVCLQSEEAEPRQLCSQHCDVSAFLSDCPESYDCLPLGDTPELGVCWPAPVVESDGCNSNSASGLSSGGVALLLLVLAILAWRRRPA